MKSSIRKRMDECTQPDPENPFHLEPDKPGFEAMGKQNGFRFWYASELASLLGYDNYQGFTTAINKAMTACNALDIGISDNFVEEYRDVAGKRIRDFKLSRFACYLAAMNGDVRKPMVAFAQAYFVKLAESLQLYFEHTEGLERVQTRVKLSEGERSLAGVAKRHGVQEYALFHNAGYRGLYNMNFGDLKNLKGIPSGRTPLDFMGREEMAANLFRITQTEAKIRNENIQGQRRLENAAQRVGEEVRATMVKTSGNKPEDLPLAEDIKNVQKKLKSTHRGLKKLDKPKKSKKTEQGI